MRLEITVTLQTHMTENGPNYSARVTLMDMEATQKDASGRERTVPTAILEAYEAFASEELREAFVEQKVEAFRQNAAAVAKWGTESTTTKVPIEGA